MQTSVTVVGGGLAGTECAWQLAQRGIDVRLVEQKPVARTPAQSLDGLAELVCSNSFRGAALSNAVGLLKEEMRRSGSLVMAVADLTRVPAGGALAVDRERFSATVTAIIDAHPRIHREVACVASLPDAADGIVVLATGPLTEDALARDLARIIGHEHLAYYDAIAPIVSAASIQWERVFRASRWDRGGDDAYVNCPMDRAQYEAFVAAVLAAAKVEPRAFEQARYFEGCLPIEVMASRGLRTLAFGPMKPVGLTDPRTGRWPYAVVQLRPENVDASAYNLVGFQTRMTWTAQAEVFRLIPGLENAEYLRFGSVHRNTFVDAPRVLDDRLALRAMPHVRLAGQITGVEGYLESAACGLLVGVGLAAELRGADPVPPPAETALGGLYRHLRTPRDDFQPSNVTWAMVPGIPDERLAKRDRGERLATRALDALPPWIEAVGGPVPGPDGSGAVQGLP